VVDDEIPGRRLAVGAEALYLANLLFAPGLAFLALAFLWRRYRHKGPTLARDHLRQTFLVSLWGGLLMVAVTGALLIFGDLAWARASGTVWVAVILYFTCIHSTLVLFGIVGLARALAGQAFRYPLIGPHLIGNRHA
jgi:hypothetical protein